MSVLLNKHTWQSFLKNVELLESGNFQYPQSNGGQRRIGVELTGDFSTAPLDLSVKKPSATSSVSDFSSQLSPLSTESSWLSEEASDDSPLDLRVVTRLPLQGSAVEMKAENAFAQTVADTADGRESRSADYGNLIHTSHASNCHVMEHTEQRELSSPNTKHYCRQCSKGFENRLSFDRHMIAHSTKLFDCFMCGRSYKQARDYRAHVAAHRNGSIFKCDICDCVLARASDYLLHLKTHRQKELMSCLHCGRYFRDSCTLSTHMRTHTGEKPYKCDICGKKFRQSGTFRRHQKVHNETVGLVRRRKLTYAKSANSDSASKLNNIEN